MKQIAKSRLNKELDVVKLTDSAEMFMAAASLSKDARMAGVVFDPSSCGGYSMSLLCYLIGISIDNPLLYPDYDSLLHFETSLRNSNMITFLVYDAGLDLLRDYMKHNYPDAKFKDYIDVFDAKVPATENYASFTIHGALDYESGRRERVIAIIKKMENEDIDVNDIELNDHGAFSLFNSLDWDGVTDNLMFTKVLDAVRKCQPDTISDLWKCINTPVYNVYGSKGEQYNHESFTTAVKFYHLAYLKAHYRTPFEIEIENERTR